MGLRPIEPFVKWLIGAATPEVAVIMAVTGYEDVELDGFTFPADGADMAKVVALVEGHHLHNVLSVVADLDRNWWRVVANWDRLVGILDAAEPKWRTGAPVHPVSLDAALTALYDRPVGPRRILLDMDGPVAAFDPAVYDLCVANDWSLDIDSPGDSRHRYFTDHIIVDDHRAACRAVLDADGWYRALPVTPGAQEGVEALLSAGHEVVVCSKPHDASPDCAAEKLAWLAEHFPMLADEYVFTRDKAYAHGGPGRPGILLDDAIVHGQVIRASWEPVTFAMSWNGPDTIYGRYPRWSWGDPIERLSW